MQSLVINLSFPAEAVIFVSDISEHYDEEFGITFTRTKFEPSVSDLVSDTFASDFSHISWSPLISKPLGKYFQHQPEPKCPTLTTYSTLLMSTIIRNFFSSYLSPTAPKKKQHSSSSFVAPYIPYNLPISFPPVLILPINPVIPPRMENISSPLHIPTTLHDLHLGGHKE